MIVYLITNNLNGKQYVGQTTKSIDTRFRRHCWASEYIKNMPICLAIKKYGKENFSIEALAKCDNQEALDALESYYAKKLNTFSPNGYNLKAGKGRGAMSEETKEKIRQANLGKKASIETRKKLSESHKGIRLSDEAKAKMSQRLKGRKFSPEHLRKIAETRESKTVYQVVSPTGVHHEVRNMKQFCIEHGLQPSNMSEVVNGKVKQHKGWTKAL